MVVATLGIAFVVVAGAVVGIYVTVTATVMLVTRKFEY